MTSRNYLVRRGVILGAALLLVGMLAASALVPLPGNASSHREAPLTAADPQIDNTDVYAFVNPNAPNRVVLISNWIPNQEPAGGPNFYSFAPRGTRYEIKIDNDGDAVADIKYRWVFTNHYRNPGSFLYNNGPVTSLTDPNLLFYQTYNLSRIGPNGNITKILRNRRVVPSRVGDASMPDYEALRDEGIYSFNDGTSKTFAGQADDPFFLDLRVFDLIYGTDGSEIGDDTLAGFNVNTFALQVPKRDLALGRSPADNPIVGIWSTASRQRLTVQEDDGNQSTAGKFVQVSRLGNPLVNEVVIPVGDKDLWNSSKPSEDGQFLEYVPEPELAEVIEAIYGVPAPDTCGSDANPPRCRNDLVEVFLTGVDGVNQPPGVTPSEQLRLNMSIPPCEGGGCSTLGVIGGDLAGYPNGRRLTDDTVDISLEVVEGALLSGDDNQSAAVAAFDAVDANDKQFLVQFPFVSLPHSGSDPSPHENN